MGGIQAEAPREVDIASHFTTLSTLPLRTVPPQTPKSKHHSKYNAIIVWGTAMLILVVEEGGGGGAFVGVVELKSVSGKAVGAYSLCLFSYQGNTLNPLSPKPRTCKP